MPVCAVVGCGNGDYGLNRWKSLDCNQHQECKHGSVGCDCPPPYTLYPFPTEKRDPGARRGWIQLIKRKDEKTGKNWMPKRFSRICSAHFPEARPTSSWPNPVLNLGYDQENLPKAVRKLPTRRSSEMSSSSRAHSEEPDPRESDPVPPVLDVILSSSFDHVDHSYATVALSTGSQAQQQQGPTGTVRQQDPSPKPVCSTKSPRSPKSKKIARSQNGVSGVERFIKDDETVRSNTGLPNKAALNALHGHVASKAGRMRYWAGVKKTTFTIRKFRRTPQKFGPGRKLTSKEELVLVLMKLRHGLTSDFLATLFTISVTTCSQVINTWIPFLAKELKPLVFWPDKITVANMLPKELGTKYRNLRCTLDCTEVFIQRPRHMELQALTWSDYKKHNTAKYLVAIAPNGMISFISNGWGGRTSDKHIVNKSGFLDLVDPADVILADRGFTIQSELLMRKARLEIPPASSGWEQQTAADVGKTKKIANARIHVERAIGRMKWFAILRNTVPITLIPILDDIVFLCAALCNLLPPLVGQ